MTSLPLRVATLTWLDRKRLWATTDRKTSLGVDRVTTFPTSLGGQSSRPSVVHRVFAPAYSLAFAIMITGLGASLVLALFGYVTVVLGGLFIEKALVLVDSILSPERSRGALVRVPGFGQGGVEGPIKFSYLVYSLLGSLDLIPGFAKTPAATPSLQGNKRWAARPLMNKKTPWNLPLGRGGFRIPPFRPYLGDWRRASDQQPLNVGSKPTAMALLKKSRGGTKNLSPITPISYNKARASLKPVTNQTPKGYSPYLSTSWLF